MSSAHRSSSSSSSSAPSEPIIDLYSWSLRSYRISPSQAYEWKKKLLSPTKAGAKGKPQSNSTMPPQVDDLTLPPSDLASLIGSISLLPQILPTNSHTPATKNQSATFQIEQPCSLLHASLWSVKHASLWSVKHVSLLSVPSHFAINPLPFLGTTKIDTHILRKIRGNLQTNHIDCDYYMTPGEKLQINKEVHLSITLSRSGQWSNRFFAQLRMNTLLPTESPAQPKRNISFLLQPQTGLHYSQLMQNHFNAQAYVDTCINQVGSDTHDE